MFLDVLEIIELSAINQILVIIYCFASYFIKSLFRQTIRPIFDPQYHGPPRLPSSLPSNFALNESFHIPNAFRKGGLCIALISCNRPFYMIESIGLLLMYIQKYEPNLNYSLIWIDTATNNQSYINIELSKRFHFDRKTFLTSTSNDKVIEGITTVYRIAVELCNKNDFFMPFEEDWKIVQNPKIGFLRTTMEILNNSPHSLMGIIYKNSEKRTQPEKILFTKVKNEKFKIICEIDRPYQFVNGVGIYRMSNMKELISKGVSNKIWFEQSLSRTAKKLGMYFGFTDLVENCSFPPGNCYGVFQHLGKISSWNTYK